MHRAKQLIYALAILLAAGFMPWSTMAQGRATTVLPAQRPLMRSALAEKGLQLGQPVFLRIIKSEKVLEVWVQSTRNNRFYLFKAYPICSYSGGLGPKHKQGDGKSPEGFYYFNQKGLNPYSRFHLSFNIGYPNAYDRAHGYTGNYLMVHGSCVSVGCYAMTDAGIEEIYTLVHEALSHGQPFIRIHIFPFRITHWQLYRYVKSPYYAFWRQLKPGYEYFETHRQPPHIIVENSQYKVQ